MKPTVEVEELQLGSDRWAVVIKRPGRSLWGRYATQEGALRAQQEACEYLRGLKNNCPHRSESGL